MNSHTLAALAEFRRQEMFADATRFRQRRSLRTGPSRVRNPLHRPTAPFRRWLSQGQL